MTDATEVTDDVLSDADKLDMQRAEDIIKLHPLFHKLTQIFFEHRQNISHDEIPAIFGAWCIAWANDRKLSSHQSLPTYEQIHLYIMYGRTFYRKEHPLDTIARIVAFFQPKKFIKKRALYVQCNRTKNLLALQPETIRALEAYVYAHFWPHRFAIIIANASTTIPAPPAPHPTTIFSWLNRVANSGIRHSETENIHKELYCAVNTPMRVAIMKPKDLAPYNCLRDWNEIYPVPWFSTIVRAAAESIPCDIFLKPELYAKNPMLVACACIAVLKAYIKTTMVDDKALIYPEDSVDGKLCSLTPTTYADADPALWCAQFSIYFDGHLAYIRLPDNAIVHPHVTPASDTIPYDHCYGPDIVYAYIGCIKEFFKTHLVLPSVWENIQAPQDTVHRARKLLSDYY